MLTFNPSTVAAVEIYAKDGKSWKYIVKNLKLDKQNGVEVYSYYKKTWEVISGQKLKKPKMTRKERIALIMLDQNASDSECFEHDHWEKDRLGRKIRVGKCKITGKEVRVEPGQPGDNSGQPIECYEHFKIRGSYLNVKD